MEKGGNFLFYNIVFYNIGFLTQFPFAMTKQSAPKYPG